MCLGFLGIWCSKVNRKSQAVELGLINDILRHTPIYFLVSCSSALLTSAFIGNTNLKTVKRIKDLEGNVDLRQAQQQKSVNIF